METSIVKQRTFDAMVKGMKAAGIWRSPFLEIEDREDGRPNYKIVNQRGETCFNAICATPEHERMVTPLPWQEECLWSVTLNPNMFDIKAVQ
jgi:hypothetical protein